MDNAKIIDESQVFLGVCALDKAQAMSYVAKKAFDLGIATSIPGLLEDLFNRENQMSTGLAGGFAIPHAKSSFVTRPAVVYVSLDASIAWSSFDGSSLEVDRLFALLVPSAEAGTTHLELLSRLAVCLIDEAFCEKLRQLDDACELAAFLQASIDAAKD